MNLNPVRFGAVQAGKVGYLYKVAKDNNLLVAKIALTGDDANDFPALTQRQSILEADEVVNPQFKDMRITSRYWLDRLTIEVNYKADSVGGCPATGISDVVTPTTPQEIREALKLIDRMQFPEELPVNWRTNKPYTPDEVRADLREQLVFSILQAQEKQLFKKFNGKTRNP